MTQKAQPKISEIYDIPLDKIDISEHNVRITHTQGNLDELAASIQKHGLLQPVVLTGAFDSPPYSLISGQRRFLAHQQILGRETIPAVFVGDISDTEALIRSLVENLQRKDLEFSDASKAVTALYTDLGSDRAVSEATGLSLQRVRDHLLVEARATPKMKQMLEGGNVSVMDVKRALKAAQDNLDKAEKLLELIAERNPPSNIKRRLVKYGSADRGKSADQIYEEASKPHIEEQIIITVDSDMQEALERASQKLEMEAMDIAQKALSEWLSEQGFNDTDISTK